MKVYSINGKGVGKLAGSVYQINHGVQIVREYNGSVSNPNTPAQINQRTRLKLQSQISAMLEPAIAIPRKGIQSPRNLFVKKNNNAFYSVDGNAYVDLADLQLTNGSVALGRVYLERSTRQGVSTLTLTLAENVPANISQVAYFIFKQNDDNSLTFVGSVLATSPSDNGNYPATFPCDISCYVVYAYGVNLTNAKARAVYGRLRVEDGAQLASLARTRTITDAGAVFTATACAIIEEGADTSPESGSGEVIVQSWAVGNGTTTITDELGTQIESGGTVTKGSNVVFTATAANDSHFDHWRINGVDRPTLTANPYTVAADEAITAVAIILYNGLE